MVIEYVAGAVKVEYAQVGTLRGDDFEGGRGEVDTLKVEEFYGRRQHVT